MRQQFKNLDTWRGKLTATWVCLAPPTAMIAVFVVGGVTSNTFVVDAHALAAPRQDAVFDELAKDVPNQPGVDGSLPTQEKSTVQVPITGTTDGTGKPIPGVFGDASGIPGTVLAAYQKAARDLAMSMPGCHITWPLLAGIGKVESGHASGGKVDANGNTRGKILGPVLDGGPGMAAIADTDQGVYDGNASWDRAVGPMQFVPGTWKAFGADGNGDGLKDPHNVFDAARAAGDYLCSGGANLADPQGLVQAVLRYNHSMDYVSTVLRWMQTYSKDTVTIPDEPGTIDTPDDDGNNNERDSTRTTTSPSTTAPTSAPTTAPTTVPTTAPTTVPTSVPATTRPTTPRPGVTSKPTSSPTSTRTPTPTPTKTQNTPTTTPTTPTTTPTTPTTTPTTPTTTPTTPTPSDPTCTPTPTGTPTTTPTVTPTSTPSPCSSTDPDSNPSESAGSPTAAPQTSN
ncbi:membrane-bound lytic murein transglycosylase B [Kribbella sp. VKM Ac-2571]|uniref:lytic transglycosylase domain-containing protein n=1 Tax=Kribbella sp. VKM Ac-2571 TaxID=2512222 RepID=UPI00105C6D80|nr:lytic transglycosylase domain-containing protein [Kribbella sp. VKM Ac-2571]TDO54085.1 membrane-bound lytic murein transglycosylase B [Kribbella sp. VKM Ac-2571]